MSFKMTKQNVPVINLQREFLKYYELIHSEDFKLAAFNSAVKPVQLPSMQWSGMSNDLFTLMVQRAVSGLETYIIAAAEYELSKLKGWPLPSNVQKCLDDPFSIKVTGNSGKAKSVKVRYDCIPALVSESLKLSTMHPELYEKTEDFYKEIRNPISHGYQLVCSYENYHVLMDVFLHMRLLYAWIDKWYTAFAK